jgi:hypothetical protein
VGGAGCRPVRASANRITGNPRTGNIATWELASPGTGWADPSDIHLTECLIQERDAGRPLPEEGSVQDTSLPRENQTVQAIGQYDGIVSPGRPVFERRCAFHRHNLEHEEHARR